MKSVHNFTFFNYFDVLLPNFVLLMLYLALSILNITLPVLYFIFPEHNIRSYNYIILNIFLKKTYHLEMYEGYLDHI